MARADEVLDRQREAWAGLAPGWEAWDAVIMGQLGPVGDAMIADLCIAEDQHHLDIASGTGEPGLSIARRAPRGRVVLTDLVAEMLAVAQRRADAQGIDNLETQVCSADELPFDDGSFESASVRFGYMFFPDLSAATAELVRVLAPGGRLSAAVWVDPDQNPWTSIAMDAIGAQVELPAPDPDGPSMYRCASPGLLRGLFVDAGLVDVVERDVEVELVTESPAEYWKMISEHVSLAVAALQRVDEPARQQIAAVATAAVARYERDGAVRVLGRARCIVGTKPGRIS